MNSQILEGKWTQVRGQVQERWGELTDDDLEQIQGKRKQLEGKLRERYGYNKKQAKSEVDQFLQETNGRAATVQAKVQEAQDRVQTRVKEAQEKLHERADVTREKVGKSAGQAEDEIRNVVPEDVVYVVDEYPWLVVIGALLMGVVIGLLLGPNRR